ncbi:hypothetical protein OSCI_1390004 [Kamptonema sp. PCC 6506]|nr:hypothetical protein OSCI_1390004 [Kamptonema sp. PCC 6506]
MFVKLYSSDSILAFQALSLARIAYCSAFGGIAAIWAKRSWLRSSQYC